MLAFPLSSTALLPCTLLAPGALLYPSPILLPHGCLLPRTLRLLLLPGLLGTLCLLLLRPLLLSLLGTLRLLLLRPLILSLSGTLLLRLASRLSTLLLLWLHLPLLLVRLGLLRLSLRLLVLCGWRSFLWPMLLLFRLALSFILLVALRVRWDSRSEKQKESGGTGSSNELHDNGLPLTSL
jgi:hypothetical protein